LETLIAWIYQHKKGIIFIDEIDKISSSDSEWQVGNRQEIMSICDLRVELTAIKINEGSWPPEMAEQMSPDDARMLVKFQVEQKLADSFVIIGAGTWQSGWTAERKAIGFRGDDTQDIVLNRNQLTRSITEEILNRFRSEVHFLKPMEREDYLAVMEEIAEIQPTFLRDQFVQIVIDALPEALESGKGMRLFEEAQTRLCVDLLMSCAGDEYVFRDVMTWR
jgi:SpoVK/Ycf46/Vps4 family AAA+-type ATPase